MVAECQWHVVYCSQARERTVLKSMNCPKCNHYCSDIIESRKRAFKKSKHTRGDYGKTVFEMLNQLNLVSVRRRRSCPKCNHRWTTFELPADSLDLLRPTDSRDKFIVDGKATMRAFAKAIRELEACMEQAVMPFEDP